MPTSTFRMNFCTMTEVFAMRCALYAVAKFKIKQSAGSNGASMYHGWYKTVPVVAHSRAINASREA